MSRPARHIFHPAARIAPAALALGLASCAVATPVVVPVMQRVLVDVATAQFVGDNCPTLGFDTAKAKAFISNAYRNLVAQGADPEAIEARTDSFEKQELGPAVAQRLEEGGVDPADPDPAAACSFGEEEKSSGSILGRVLS
ncbi:DUF5333 family protein [Mangrovicoccus sp. HB161399]|uniref:DUF5333 family protein n=1 Tax=Mangrovicoccus sp. HB161399 TaxID=2720392 RepID=UPI00155740D4|nr:DUF5333 family protein [Mangrovicoccus sp. HB161399]